MTDHCDIRPTLPRDGDPGQEICDRYGNLWVFDPDSKGWIIRGAITEPPIVTESNSGIITPDIYTQLQQLRAVVNSGVDLTPLKLLPGRDGYWYYFYSSDKTFRFKPEGPDCLRIEIDRGRIYSIVAKQSCLGDKGLKGNKGPKGDSGRPGAIEQCYTPVISGNALSFAIFTPAPLVLDGSVPLPNDHVPEISVRLFEISASAQIQNEDQLFATAIYLQTNDATGIIPQFTKTRELYQQQALGEIQITNDDLSDVAIISNGSIATEPSVTVEIDPTGATSVTVVVAEDGPAIDIGRTQASMVYDAETGVACGTFYLQAGSTWENSWCVKSRQKGPDGLIGDPGECRVEVVECTIDDTNIVAICPIINARVDCQLDLIYTLCTDLIDEFCVNFISLQPNSGTLADNDALKSIFAAAEMTLEECKRIFRFDLALDSDAINDPDLIHWDPQPGCATRRHYDRHKFDWISLTNIPACDSQGTWFGPDTARPGMYPYELTVANQPPEDECCADDFFFCPNVQDGACEGDPPPVPPVPPSPPTPPPAPPTPPPAPPVSPLGLAAKSAAERHEQDMLIQNDNSIVHQGVRVWNVKI